MAGSGCLHHSRWPWEHLEELADRVIDLIGNPQEPDGYLNTYFSVNAPAKKWTNLVEGHELYTAGHMIEAAVAYYQATGKEKILNIAKKNADLICRVFGTGGARNEVIRDIGGELAPDEALPGDRKKGRFYLPTGQVFYPGEGQES